MNLQQLHFANPGWLAVACLAPLVVLAFFLAGRAERSTLFVGNTKLVEFSPGLWRTHWLPWLLRLSVLLLCVIAAARPQAGRKKVEHKTPVTDLLVALDVSGSMMQNDLQPNRITAAKKILAEFLDKVKNVRLGLSVFAGISFTQCPMTTDIGVVKSLLSNVEVSSVKVNGTAIGDALVASLNRIQGGTGKKEDSPKKDFLSSKLFPRPEDPPSLNHQAIILLTDGSSNAGFVDPLSAAKIAASRGVKIYTIGIGTPEGIPLVYVDPLGRKRYALDAKGEIIRDAVDQKTLGQIAALSGGKFFLASTNYSLQAVLDEIAGLEKRDEVTVTNWEYQEWAPYFLLAAFMILLLDAFLGMTFLRTLP